MKVSRAGSAGKGEEPVVILLTLSSAVITRSASPVTSNKTQFHPLPTDCLQWEHMVPSSTAQPLQLS